MNANKSYKLAILIISCLFIQSAIAQTPTEVAAHKRKWDTPAWTDTIHNPYAKITTSADSGKVTYLQLCSVCHGTGGKGDGVAAAGLTIKPANHTSAIVQSQTDGSLFFELTNGHAPMPAYKTTLTDKQRWQLVCFIRTLKPKSPKK
jgi:mono/diheme cytochrome c family protein